MTGELLGKGDHASLRSMADRCGVLRHRHTVPVGYRAHHVLWRLSRGTLGYPRRTSRGRAHGHGRRVIACRGTRRRTASPNVARFTCFLGEAADKSKRESHHVNHEIRGALDHLCTGTGFAIGFVARGRTGGRTARLHGRARRRAAMSRHAHRGRNHDGTAGSAAGRRAHGTTGEGARGKQCECRQSGEHHDRAKLSAHRYLRDESASRCFRTKRKPSTSHMKRLIDFRITRTARGCQQQSDFPRFGAVPSAGEYYSSWRTPSSEVSSCSSNSISGRSGKPILPQPKSTGSTGPNSSSISLVTVVPSIFHFTTHGEMIGS